MQVDRSVAGDRDRQRPRDLHRGEQGLGDQLIFHGPVLSASDHPDVAGPQPVAQFGEQAEFVSGDIDGAACRMRGAAFHEPARRWAGSTSTSPVTISGQSRRDSTARASARSRRLQARPRPMFLICPLSVFSARSMSSPLHRSGFLLAPAVREIQVGVALRLGRPRRFRADLDGSGGGGRAWRARDGRATWAYLKSLVTSGAASVRTSQSAAR